jgi:hypothetical protein
VIEMAKKIRGNLRGAGNPWAWKAVTLADSDLPAGQCNALLVLTADADIAAVNSDGTDVLFEGCPSGLLIPGGFTQVKSTGSTAGAKVYAAYTE